MHWGTRKKFNLILKLGLAYFCTINYDRSWSTEYTFPYFTNDFYVFYALLLDVPFWKNLEIHDHFNLTAMQLASSPLTANTLIVAEIGLLWSEYLSFALFQ